MPYDCFPKFQLDLDTIPSSFAIPPRLRYLHGLVMVLDHYLEMLHPTLARDRVITLPSSTDSSSHPSNITLTPALLAHALRGIYSSLSLLRAALQASTDLSSYSLAPSLSPIVSSLASSSSSASASSSSSPFSSLVPTHTSFIDLSQHVLSVNATHSFLLSLHDSLSTNASSPSSSGLFQTVSSLLSVAIEQSLSASIVDRILAVGSTLRDLHGQADVSILITRDTAPSRTDGYMGDSKEQVQDNLQGIDDEVAKLVKLAGIMKLLPSDILTPSLPRGPTKPLIELEVDCRGHVYLKGRNSQDGSNSTTPTTASHSSTPSPSEPSARVLSASIWLSLRELCGIIRDHIATPNIAPTLTVSMKKPITTTLSSATTSSSTQTLPSNIIEGMNLLTLSPSLSQLHYRDIDSYPQDAQDEQHQVKSTHAPHPLLLSFRLAEMQPSASLSPLSPTHVPKISSKGSKGSNSTPGSQAQARYSLVSVIRTGRLALDILSRTKHHGVQNASQVSQLVFSTSCTHFLLYFHPNRLNVGFLVISSPYLFCILSPPWISHRVPLSQSRASLHTLPLRSSSLTLQLRHPRNQLLPFALQCSVDHPVTLEH